MMRYGIPAYRMPRDVLDGELDRIAAMGVRITLGHRVQDLGAERREGGFDAAFVAVGAHLARGVETVVVAQQALVVLAQLCERIASGDTQTFDDSKWDPGTWPSAARGFGLHAGPRGALSHWVEINDGKVSNYQVVSPTTWNAGPRDTSGQRGPYEAALVGTPVHDPTQPVEILRTLHSFDPCMACAAHILDADGSELLRIKVQCSPPRPSPAGPRGRCWPSR